MCCPGHLLGTPLGASGASMALFGVPWGFLGGLGGHFWAQLALFGVPWGSQGGLGWSLWAHFARPRPPMATRAMAACCALWRPSGALWRSWVAPWPLFWRAIAAFLGGFLVASNMHRKSQIFWCFHEVLQSYSKDRGEFLRWYKLRGRPPSWRGEACAS